MEKGLLLKIILIILAIIVFGFATKSYLQKLWEYKKSQDHLASSLQTKLPDIPLEEVKYPVESYAIPGSCWLESAAGIAKFLEPGLDLDTFIFYGQPTLFMASRNEYERYGPGFNHLQAFVNLGYVVYRGSLDPMRPPINIYPSIKPDNFITFRNKKESLTFAKKLLSAGIIPIIAVNRTPLGLGGGGGDFNALAGYDSVGVWLNSVEPGTEGANLMESPKTYEARFVDNETFLQAWRESNYEWFWMEKTGERKSEQEIFILNKKNAREAPANIEFVINYLKETDSLWTYTDEFDIPPAISLSRSLEKRGYQQLANQYFLIAKTYDEARESLGPHGVPDAKFMIKVLTEIKPLIEKVATMWP